VPYEINIPTLTALTKAGQDASGLPQAAGESVWKYVRAYIYNLDFDRANQLGGERSHFYRKAALGTTLDVDDEGADITVHQTGFRQRLLGGEIHAKNVKYLTIPAIAEAYGHPAKDFELRFIMFRSGSKALAGKGQDARVYYWLKESVNQDPDPSVLPSEDAIRQAAMSGARSWLAGLTK
jgi:hypothetical protein